MSRKGKRTHDSLHGEVDVWMYDVNEHVKVTEPEDSLAGRPAERHFLTVLHEDVANHR